MSNAQWIESETPTWAANSTAFAKVFTSRKNPQSEESKRGLRSLGVAMRVGDGKSIREGQKDR